MTTKNSKIIKAPAWQVGDVVLDEALVQEALGAGEMGVVYKVYHQRFEVALAMRCPSADMLADEEGKARFMREVANWVQLGLHPHVVTCHYVRMIEQMPCIFAEHVPGGSLQDWIRERTLYEGGHEVGLERMLDVAIQLAWGLSYAHQFGSEGVIHANVKPSNVMMMPAQPNPIAKLTDFGLAKAREVAPTPERIVYQSPEQSHGEPLTAKSDMWGWGVSILQMFMGEATWQGSRAPDEVLLENYLQKGTPCADAHLLPPMPSGLASLLQTCFEHDPAKRPASMNDIAERLIAIYSEEIGHSYAPKQPEAATPFADHLNNQAFSLAELGEIEQAMPLWQAAIHDHPQHVASIYNFELARWRRGEISDDALVLRLKNVCNSFPNDWLPQCLLAQVHLEHGDLEGAITRLEAAAELAPDEPQIEVLLERACSENMPTARCFAQGAPTVAKVTSVAVKGRLALSAAEDHTLKLWDLTDGRCLRTFKGHTDRVNSVATDGGIALSGGDDGTIKVWDLAEGGSFAQGAPALSGHTSSVLSVAVEGSLALSGSKDKTLKVWDLADGHCLYTFKGHTRSVTSVAIEGRQALSGSDDRTIKVWDLAEGRCLRTLEGHMGAVTSVAVKGRRALSGSKDKTLKLWDLTDGRCLHTLEGHTGRVYSVALAASGHWALSGSKDKTLKLWDLADGRCLRTLKGHTSSVLSVAVEGRLALSGSEDQTVKMWLLPSFQMSWQLAGLWSYDRWAKVQEVSERWRRASEENLQKKHFVAALASLQQARQDPEWSWNRANLDAWSQLYPVSRPTQLRAAWHSRTLEGHTDWVSSVAITPDGLRAISSSHNYVAKSYTIKVWDLADGRCLHTFQGDAIENLSVALSDCGRWALALFKKWKYHDEFGDNTLLKMWDLADGRCLLTQFIDHLNWAQLFASIREVLGGHHHQIRIKLSFEVIEVLLDANYSLALLGRELWNNALELWDLALGRLFTLKGHTGRVTPVALSAGGRFALSSSDDGTLKLWDFADGRCLRTIEGFGLGSVALSANGRWALSPSFKEIKVWDLAEGRGVPTLSGHTSGLTSERFSADGRWALSGSRDGTVELWALDWELETFDEADWDEGARPYLVNFLTQHTPFVGQLPQDRWATKEDVRLALTRRGKPTWSEDAFQGLIRQLQYAGYGWLRPEGVRRQLMQMAQTWTEPPPLFAADHANAQEKPFTSSNPLTVRETLFLE